MRTTIRLALFGVALGLLLASCPSHDTAPTPAPTTQKGAPAWP
ncbi:hypothetical protein ACQB60_02770 [Actinomycetota bacterium Odt1-20B]